MLFDSPVYFIFLILVVVGYWTLSHRKQNWFLLAASYFFYGWWDWRFLGLMLISTTLDYFIAQRIEATINSRQRKRWLALSVALNLTFLGFFKYFNFFIDSFAASAEAMGLHHLPLPVLRVILPPGISFYTFQEIAYIVDVYYGKQKPARSFVDYALFVSLFPHLIAGPIQRPSHLLGQVQNPRAFDATRFYDGLMLIVFGLFRKSVIADNMGILANLAFNGGLGHGFFPTVIGACAFGLQIYGDFSGYTDFARGSAQLLGFQFMLNFRRPYLASNLQEFWRRWHISLSSWLRDYLYIPLGGSRKGSIRTYLNLMITMLLGGLWHGANWTFVVWGGIHGVWLAIERFAGEHLNLALPAPVVKAISRTITLIVVSIAWLFFRAATVQKAAAMLADMTNLQWIPALAPALIYLLIAGGIVIGVDILLERHDEEYPFQLAPQFAPATAVALLGLTVLFGAAGSNAFIYFQF